MTIEHLYGTIVQYSCSVQKFDLFDREAIMEAEKVKPYLDYIGGRGKNRGRVVLHSDMNNFFASVECMLRPEISAFPVAVCGSEV